MNMSNIYIWSFASGVFIYLLLEIDKKYFNNTEESSKFSSLRIAMTVSIVVWLIFVYYLNDIICGTSKSSTFEKIQIRDDPF